MKDKKKKNELLKRFEDKGYTDLAEFMRRTNCPLAKETVRKAIYDGQVLSEPIMARILFFLDYGASDVVKFMSMWGYTFTSEMLNKFDRVGDNQPLTIDEQALIDVYYKLMAKGGIEVINHLVDYMDMAGKSLKLDLSDDVIKLRRKVKPGGSHGRI